MKEILDVQIATTLGNDWWVAAELYNNFNVQGERFSMDFEIYAGKTWSTPVENLNAHVTFGSENYGFFTKPGSESSDVYINPRVDYTLQVGPTAVVPYIAYTSYHGEGYTASDAHCELEYGVEFTTKF